MFGTPHRDTHSIEMIFLCTLKKSMISTCNIRFFFWKLVSFFSPLCYCCCWPWNLCALVELAVLNGSCGHRSWCSIKVIGKEDWQPTFLFFFVAFLRKEKMGLDPYLDFSEVLFHKKSVWWSITKNIFFSLLVKFAHFWAFSQIMISGKKCLSPCKN